VNQNRESLPILYLEHEATQKLTLTAGAPSAVSAPIDAPAVFVQVVGGIAHFVQGRVSNGAISPAVSSGSTPFPPGEQVWGHKYGESFAFLRHASVPAGTTVEVYLTPMEQA